MVFKIKLKPQYDRRKSFYGKANVFSEDGRKVLRSYDTDVAEIRDGKAYVFGTYSSTTLRHIKEFLLQNGFKAENKAQIIKDYGVDRNNKTSFGVMDKSGKVTETMRVNLSEVKSDDPIAYSFGFAQGKRGEPMSKIEKGEKLAPEYIRGYNEGRKEYLEK